MPKLKERSRQTRQRSAAKHLSLEEALKRVDEPWIAESLSKFYARLAKAQSEGDREAIAFIQGSIGEAMRGVPDGPIDMPLSEALRRRAKGGRR